MRDLAAVSASCLLGGAIGDALGYPVEFVGSGAAIVAAHGRDAPPRLLRCSDGEVHFSDDTQMTLFTAEGLTRARLAAELHAGAGLVEHVHAAYQRWLYTQWPDRFERPESGGLLDEPALVARRAPGNTCLRALSENVQNARVPTVASPPNDSKGCGAVMRSAPFGIAARDRAEAFASSRDCAVLTHGHPSGYLSAAYFASLVFDLARGARLNDAMASADALLAEQEGRGELVAALARARALPPSPGFEVLEALPDGGWVGEWAVAIAIACVREVDVTREQDVARALWRAAAHGGDSDSTASLAGNLLGAMGASLPHAWLEDLELRPLIERAARDLVGTHLQ
jgi:ADP-ribosylglycohydrolase